MTLTINTNISSLIAQRSLNKATTSLNLALEKMSTGYKINHAQDNAAGYSIANMWKTQISSLDVSADNAATGSDLLTTAEQSYSLLTSHLQRIRDLTEQAANGTYGSASLRSIQSEIYARLQEINRISANSEFNGIKLMAYNDSATGNENAGIGITDQGINLQVGLYSNKNSVINLDISLFTSAAISSLFRQGTTTYVSQLDKAGDIKNENSAYAIETALQLAGLADYAKLNTEDGLRCFAAACSGLKYTAAADPATDGEGTYTLLSDEASDTTPVYGASAMIGFIDNAIDEISRRVTKIGAAQNRVESAISAIDVQSQNLMSSLSTLRDTDVAQESSNYIQAQILQQASATLLSTANQLPSMALNLI